MIECVECPVDLISTIKKSLPSIQHLVFINSCSVMEDLEFHYKQILREVLNKPKNTMVSLPVGELLWQLICLSSLQKLPELAVNSLKSVLISSLCSLIQHQCEETMLKQVKGEVYKSIVNYASLFKYCFENPNMQLYN